MLNEVDDTLMVPSEHLFDFNDDKDSLPTEPDEEHTLLREFGFIQ